MIDKKISELDKAQPVSSDDILVITQNINGTLQTRRVTVNDLFSSYAAARVLVINNANVSQYFTPIEGDVSTDVYFYLPDRYATIVVETTDKYKIVKIKPVGGVDFEDYKKFTITGNVSFWEGSSGNGDSVNSGNYRISRYWYSHRFGHGSDSITEAFTEFILKNKVWYSLFY